jgi:hypothetical protein
MELLLPFRSGLDLIPPRGSLSLRSDGAKGLRPKGSLPKQTGTAGHTPVALRPIATELSRTRTSCNDIRVMHSTGC